MHFPAGYATPAAVPAATPRASARTSAATCSTPLRYSLPEFRLRAVEAPADRKRPSECLLSYPEGYCREAPSVRCPSLSDPTSSPTPPGLAGLVSRMLEEDTSRLALRPTSFTLLAMCEQLYDPRRCTAARTLKARNRLGSTGTRGAGFTTRTLGASSASRLTPTTTERQSCRPASSTSCTSASPPARGAVERQPSQAVPRRRWRTSGRCIRTEIFRWSPPASPR
jgi:hypothetical protein